MTENNDILEQQKENFYGLWIGFENCQMCFIPASYVSQIYMRGVTKNINIENGNIYERYSFSNGFIKLDLKYCKENTVARMGEFIKPETIYDRIMEYPDITQLYIQTHKEQQILDIPYYNVPWGDDEYNNPDIQEMQVFENDEHKILGILWDQTKMEE